MSGRRASAVLACFAFASIQCASASSYRPEEPGRIHFVRTEEGRFLEKDGQLYSMSGWKGGVVRAVSGNPLAEEHARAYVRRTRSSVVFLLVAGALIVPGAALQTTEPGHTGQRLAATGFLVTGMTAALAALLMPALARHHLYDAVNVYNDDVTSRSAGGRLPADRSMDLLEKGAWRSAE